MRIHELAKELKVSSGIILKAAKGQGMDVTTTLSSLNEDEARRIRSSFATSAESTAEAASASSHAAAIIAAKRERAAAASKAKAKAEIDRLAAIQKNAREIERELKDSGGVAVR